MADTGDYAGADPEMPALFCSICSYWYRDRTVGTNSYLPADCVARFMRFIVVLSYGKSFSFSEGISVYYC